MLYFVYAKIPSFNSSICNVLHTSFIFADNQNFFIFMQEENAIAFPSTFSATLDRPSTHL